MKRKFLLVICLLALTLACRSNKRALEQPKATGASASALNLKDANQLLAKNRCAEAIPLYQKFLEKYPKDSGAWNLLGLAYVCDQKPDLALNAFKQALQITPAYTDVHNNLGVAYMATKQHELARMEFLKALEDNTYPKAAPYFNLAKLSFMQGNYEESRALAKKVIELTPKQQHQAGPLLLYSLSLEKLNRVEEARASYQQLLKMAPDNLEASYCLGNLLLQQHQDCQARVYFQRVADAAPMSELGQKSITALKGLSCPP